MLSAAKDLGGTAVVKGSLGVLAQFTEITRRALQEVVSDRVKDRLKSALADEAQASVPPAPPSPVEEEDRVVTSELERDGYNIVRAIVTEVIEPSRITMRDQQSYCGVLLDNNNRRPICRLWFNGSRKYLGLFDEAKVETRIPITDVAEIFKYSAQLKEAAQRHSGPVTGTVAADTPPTDVQTA